MRAACEAGAHMTAEFVWGPGSATGIGSLPGQDIGEALSTVFGELPDLPYLPELPRRGPGADMIGRAAGLLVEMPVELYAGRWRIASHSGLDARRTKDLWERDLDGLTDHASAHDGPLKLQVAGVWTLAASVDLQIGGRLLRDAGAVRDLTASLAEGIATHVAEVSARLPHTRILLQIDEPSLPAVLAGHVPTESGFSVLHAVEAETATAALAQLIKAAAVPTIVHCCAADAPLGMFRDAGAIGFAIDLDLVTDLDPLGEALEAGMALFAGVVPTTPSEPGRDGGPVENASAVAAKRVRDLWKTIGFSINDLPKQVVITPACGLASATAAQALQAMTTSREAARRLADD